MSVPIPVEIREVGPRDGLQMEEPVDFAAKCRWLESLVAAGLTSIEATAFVSPRAVPAMADAAQVAQFVQRLSAIRWAALVASPNGARRAVDAGIVDVEYVVSAADGHSQANTRRSSDEAVAAVAEVAELVHAADGTCEVIIATAWDCPFDGPTPPSRTAAVAASAVELGADRLCLGDTIGTATPTRVERLLRHIRAAHPSIPLGAHFHDTRGTGIANAWTALRAGVTRLDASIGGLGGCPFAPGASGNIATEELVYSLSESDYTTPVDLAALLRAAAETERLVGHPLDSSLYRANGPSTPRGAGR